MHDACSEPKYLYYQTDIMFSCSYNLVTYSKRKILINYVNKFVKSLDGKYYMAENVLFSLDISYGHVKELRTQSENGAFSSKDEDESGQKLCQSGSNGVRVSRLVSSPESVCSSS